MVGLFTIYFSMMFCNFWTISDCFPLILFQREDVHYSLFGQKLVIPDLWECSAPPDSEFRPRTGIADLPTELLLWIFSVLASSATRNPYSMNHYRDHVRGNQECDCNQHWTEEEFPESNTVFPYAPAQVCRHWRGVLALQPTFWTRVIVSRIAGVHTPPACFKEYLEYSRELTIDVYIGNIGYERGFPHERALIEEYTRVLSPHLHRCRVIDYDVRYATSLPLLWRDLHTIPQMLYSLQLRSEETHDPTVADPWPKLEDTNMYNIPWSEFKESRGGDMRRKKSDNYYSKMVLDGWNLLVACGACQDLFVCDDLVVQNYRRSLNVYHETDENDHIGLADILCTLGKKHDIDTVSFVNVGLPKGVPDDLEDLLGEFIDFPNVIFDNVEFTMIEEFSRFHPMVQPERFVIKACSFPATYGPLHFNRVELVDIQDAEDLSYFLHRWDGGELTIRACPGMTDTVLRELGSPEWLDPADIEILVIIDCLNVTYAGVFELIALRTALGLPIQEITVQGAAHAISAAQYEAIQEHEDILDFVWEARVPWSFRPADPIIEVMPELTMEDDKNAVASSATDAHDYMDDPSDHPKIPAVGSNLASTAEPISYTVHDTSPAVLDRRVINPWRMYDVDDVRWDGSILLDDRVRVTSNNKAEEMAVDNLGSEPCTTNELWEEWITGVQPPGPDSELNDSRLEVLDISR